LDFARRRPGLAIGNLRSAVGLGPARENEPRPGGADSPSAGAVALGGARLAAKLADAGLLVGEQLVEPNEVCFGRAKFLLGVLAADVKPRDPGGFLEQHAALDRLGGDNRADSALRHECRGMRPRRGVGEQQRDILRADIATVEAVGRARAALDSAGNLAVAIVCVDQQRDLCEVARRPTCGAGEDDVVHAAAAKRLGAALAHHPANRLEQVRLAAAVGADDPGQPGFDAQFGGFDEALETAEL
jgi:hypothetical protein